MSGNICAATNSRSQSSKATTISSTRLATPGHSSPTIITASHPSQQDLGHRSFLRAVGISYHAGATGLQRADGSTDVPLLVCLEIAYLLCTGLEFRVTSKNARSFSFRFRDPSTGRLTRALI